MTAPDETRDPWRRRSRRVAYENPWIQVWHDEVVRPDGSDGVYGVVHTRSMAAGVVALDDDERVLLVGQWRYALGRYSWELPEGGVPHGEDPLVGIQRELREETGFRARHWEELVRTTLSNSVMDEEGVLFLATGLEPGEAEPEPTEELAVRWVALGDAVGMVERGELHDSLTQIGILLVARRRGTPAA